MKPIVVSCSPSRTPVSTNPRHPRSHRATQRDDQDRPHDDEPARQNVWQANGRTAISQMRSVLGLVRHARSRPRYSTMKNAAALGLRPGAYRPSLSSQARSPWNLVGPAPPRWLLTFRIRSISAIGARDYGGSNCFTRPLAEGLTIILCLIASSIAGWIIFILIESPMLHGLRSRNTSAQSDSQ
jgi:hypothetical protein